MQLFYHNELKVYAPSEKSDVLLEWEGLVRRGFPLVFHGVIGEDMQEGNSPSWYNPVEALQVVKYVQALKDNATFAPRLSEVGVVTPYRKQVEKIRQLLRKLGCCEGGGAVGGVKVGSVEEFQGQERTAIIISMVRGEEGWAGRVEGKREWGGGGGGGGVRGWRDGGKEGMG